MNINLLGNVSPSVWGGRTNQGRVYGTDGLAPTLDAMTGGGRQPHIIEAERIFFMDEKYNKWIWEVDGKKYLIRIRKLTPKECWRLMDFATKNEDGSWNDADFLKAEAVCSNTRLYSQAGNSIVKKILQEVFKKLTDVVQ